jgi:hypothetical protein
MTQNILGHLLAYAFSVDQEYSLTGCSPAEPVSAYPDETNLNTTMNYEQNSYPPFLGFR